MFSWTMCAILSFFVLLGPSTEWSCWSFVPPSPPTITTSWQTKKKNPVLLFAGPVPAELLVQSMPALQMGFVAAASAVAGMMTQQPRIQELEEELRLAYESLNATKLEMASKINDLEDRLFNMDREYEEQTARFKKRYDARVRDELAQFKEKVKTDFQYRLEIELNRQKSAMLMTKYDNVNGGVEREARLSQLRVERERMEEMNSQLEKALQDSQRELERMREAVAASKKGIMGFFSR